MHILLTNDDGPPNAKHSPYIQDFASKLASNTDWALTIAVPSEQRSWIGKAHMIGSNVTASFAYTKGVDGELEGPFDQQQSSSGDRQEWVLLTGTPASCANIGVRHLADEFCKPPVDLVVSGPNYGRNTSSAYMLASGTIGGSLEAALTGTRSIALSYSYSQPKHSAEQIATASEIAVKLVRHLVENWDPEVDLYSINIPLGEHLGPATKVRLTAIYENNWSDIFASEKRDAAQHADTEPLTGGKLQFRWAPNFAKCDADVLANGQGTDAHAVMHNEISITPLKAAYKQVESVIGREIDLNNI